MMAEKSNCTIVRMAGLLADQGPSMRPGAWSEGRYHEHRRHSLIGQVGPVGLELQYSTQRASTPLAA